MKNSIINIFMTTDAKYMRYLGISVASILYNTKSFCHFYVLADNVSDFKKRQIEELKSKFNNFDITWIDLDEKNRQYITDTFIAKSKTNVYTKNIANYSRFLMPDLLPDVHRALYMDTDILVYGDVTELYNTDLANFGLGAIACSHVMTKKDVAEKVVKYINPQHIYFNAGILLIDCDKWRAQNIFKKIAECDAQIVDRKLFNTQDPLNKCFECNYQILPHKFNWFGAYPNEAKAPDDLVIRHFPGDKPDMAPQNYDIELVGDFYFFAGLTPFFEEAKLANRKKTTTRIKLFGCIPLIKVRKGVVYLFDSIKLLKVTK